MIETSPIPHQALYRRWRAQTFSEIVGQDAVVRTLRNAVKNGRVAHAILFTGPRGTGKTSLARILAKAVNCTDLQADGDPCDRCPSCVAIREGRALDLVEIDAASNRGIDAVRDLRERIHYAPTDLRRKVYILDEAHQITRDAWNALLKSLEEPPDFVTFMFASTHPQEFPPAILSRLQRYDVRRLTVPEIVGKLERILEADGRQADPDAVRLVARLAAGGMRDAESILDQLLSSTDDSITAAGVRDLLGLADAESVDRFVNAVATGDAATGIAILDALEERGRDLRVFLDQVVDALRDRLVALIGGPPGGEREALTSAARRFGALDTTRLGPGGIRLQLELALLAQPTPAPAAALPAVAVERPARARGAAEKPKPARETMATPAQTPPTAAPPDAIPVGGVPSHDLDRLRHGWAQIVASVRPATRALIAECRPLAVEGNVVTLGFPETKAFLKDVAERKASELGAAVGGHLGREVSVRCVATNLDLVPALPTDDEAAHLLREAQRIFADDLAAVPEVD